MRLSIVISLPCAPPAWFGRVLVPLRAIASVREGRAFAIRNADTWRDALEPGESHFVAWFVDSDGEPVRTMEFGRERGSAPVEIGRAALARMRKTTTTAKGESI